MAELKQARVPDIGGYEDVPVIEVLVAVGDTVQADQGLITLESDKATMEVPSPFAGVVRELKAKLGDTLSQGSVVALIEPAGDVLQEKKTSLQSADKNTGETKGAESDVRQSATAQTSGRDANNENRSQSSAQTEQVAKPAQTSAEDRSGPSQPSIRFDAGAVLPEKVPYASPAVRLFARELGVDLGKVAGSERGGRIGKQDVQKFVKSSLQDAGTAAASAGLALLPWPKVDFAKFGEVETRELTRIQKLSGANLSRNWAMIPHVTQHDDADITELEALRVTLNEENAKRKDGAKLTMLAFLVKASVAALRAFPDFNASLDASGQTLTLKKYFHIGFAADTPNGLVVPVIRDCDRKGVLEIARETAQLATSARDGKLGPAQMQGGCFTISSLGGIGGTGFTPIVNAPEVAILGVSKSALRPVWNGETFAPRLLLPLSLSYDHRVIDGAAAARFTAYLAQLLSDLRRALL